MVLRKIVLATCAATAFAVLAGCGGGSTDAPAAGGVPGGGGTTGGTTGGSTGGSGGGTTTIQGISTPASVAVVTATNAN